MWLRTRGSAGSLGWGNVIRRNATFKLPTPVFAHERVVVATGLRNDRLAVRAGRHERPARPGCRRISLHVDDEVRKNVKHVSSIWTGPQILLHESLDACR